MVLGDGILGGSKSAGGADLIKDTTDAAFMADVIEASREVDVTVIVDFWAPWCGPCKQLTPILEKAVREAGGKVRLVKINIEEQRDVAAQMGVQSIPTVAAFKDGRPVDGFQGAQSEAEVKAFIARLEGDDGGGDLQAAIDSAKAALSAGDLTGAAKIFAGVLQDDQQSAPALAGLAGCYLKTGDLERAEQTIQLVPPDQQSGADVVAVQAGIDLARKAQGTGEVSQLESALAADPANHQTRFDLALAIGAAGDKAGAVDHLIEIMTRERKWNDEAARRQLLQFFEAWGPMDPGTVDGRRRLSTILFS